MLWLLLAGSVAVPPASVAVPSGALLTAQVEAADAKLFKMFFEGTCDVPRFRAMLADDLEFYHDKDGFAARGGDAFADAFAKNCKSREDPTTWRSRRELVRSSLHVDPVPGWGAIETGDHLFYERQGAAGQEKLVGKAKFAMVWVLGSDGNWRLSRVLSFAHSAAE